MIKGNGKAYLSDELAVADPSFFSMFSFPFVKGDPETALNERYSVVITESAARKFFGNEDPMGKILKLQIRREPFIVTGVIKDIPENSHIHFECIIPFLVCTDWFHADPESWKMSMYYTYIQTADG